MQSVYLLTQDHIANNASQNANHSADETSLNVPPDPRFGRDTIQSTNETGAQDPIIPYRVAPLPTHLLLKGPFMVSASNTALWSTFG
jgi:hypothetical protein